jgi:branched-chain amino acid transport system permease protein
MSTAPPVLDAVEATEAIPEAPPAVAARRVPVGRIIGIAAFLVAALVIPNFFGDFGFFVGQYALVYAMIGLSITIVTGYSGLISLMPYTFAGIGAVVTGLVMSVWGWPFWLAIAAAALATFPVAVLVGVASVRLKGLYLAIATLTFSQALGETFFKWESATGGRRGWIVDKPKVGGVSFSQDLAFYVLCLAVVLLMVWMIEGLRTSRLGRAMLAVRDNELEAQALGINSYKTKLAAFVLGGMVAGVGGAFLALLLGNISPSAFQSPLAEVTSILLVTLVVIGGIDRAWGAFFGAIVLVVNQQIAAGAELFFAFLGIYVAAGLIFFLLRIPGGLVQATKIQIELVRRRPVFGIVVNLFLIAVNLGIALVFINTKPWTIAFFFTSLVVLIAVGVFGAVAAKKQAASA